VAAEAEARRWSLVGTYLVLTLVVWGLFAVDRGLWQDDVAILAVVQTQTSASALGVFAPIVAPTRRLLGLPFALALATPQPVLALQLLYGATWLGVGLAMYWLGRLLAPGRRDVAYLAGALTLCATGDFLTDSPVALGYDVSTLAFVAALCHLLRWLRGGGGYWLIGSAVLVTGALWTMEAVLPSVVLAPLLLWAAREGAPSRRWAIGTLVWFALLAPFLATLIPFLVDRHSYAATAFVPLRLPERLQRTAGLFANNFTPWRWAFRPVWFPRPEPVIPLGIRVPASALGTAVFLWGARHLPWATPTSTRPKSAPRLLAGISLLMALASNATAASLQLSDIFYRTQVVSRVWTSLFLALASSEAVGWLGRRHRLVGLLLPSTFVVFGLAGGLERQDFFLASWRQHRVELASILEEAPWMQPDAWLVLYTPPVAAFLATEAPYLARCWAVVLYQDPSMAGRLFLWSRERKTGCRAEERAFRCWEEPEAACVAAGTCDGLTLPYEKVVLMSYAAAEGRFRLQRQLPAELLGDRRRSGLGYAPEAMIGRRPVGRFPHRLLFEAPLLARYLPAFRDQGGPHTLSPPEPR